MYCSKCGHELDANNMCNNPSCPGNLNPDYNINDNNISGYTQNLNIQYKAPYDNSYTNSSTLQYNNDYSNDFSNQYGDDYYGVFPEEMASFVGYKNTEYYMNKWNTYQFNNNFVSWNWPAFFFGFLWCGYRKMYNWMGILFCISFLKNYTLMKLLGASSPNKLFIDLGISIIINLCFALFANQLYIKECFKKITKLKYAFPSLSINDLMPRLSQKGGTTIVPVVLYFVVCILLAIILYLILISALSDMIMMP